MYTNILEVYTLILYDQWKPMNNESWRVSHVGQEILTLSEHLISLPLGSSWFHPFIIQIIYIVYYWICQFYDYVYLLMTGLFAWISLTALSRTYAMITGEFFNWSLTYLALFIIRFILLYPRYKCTYGDTADHTTATYFITFLSLCYNVNTVVLFWERTMCFEVQAKILGLGWPGIHKRLWSTDLIQLFIISHP